MNLNNLKYTGVANDDRRIASELMAMGAFDKPSEASVSPIFQVIEALSQFVTWMRWKGEVGVYGCRVGAQNARRAEAKLS